MYKNMEQEHLHNPLYSSIFLRLFLGIPYSTMKRAKSSEESISTKRKHVTEISSTRTNGIPANRPSHDQSTKKLKANTNDQQNALAVEIYDTLVHSRYDIGSTF